MYTCYVIIITCSTAGVNYRGLSSYPVIFNTSSTETSVNISLIMTNQTVLETDDVFLVSLSLAREGSSGVKLKPENATVSIYEISGEGIYYYLVFV